VGQGENLMQARGGEQQTRIGA